MKTKSSQTTERSAWPRHRTPTNPARGGPPPRTGAARYSRLARILVPLDFSESATEALRFALPFARESEARLDLLHVVMPVVPPAETSYPLPDWSQYEIQERRDAAARIKALAAAEVPRPLYADILVRSGEPASTIVTVAKERRSQWVVLATQGRTGFKRFFLGSTAEAVVRRAPCPVLTVRRRVLARIGTRQTPPAERIHRILVPVDFSAPSRRMLPYAVTLATQFRASLLLLHVVRPIRCPTRVGCAAGQLQSALLRQGRHQLAGWARRLVPPDVTIEQRVGAGTPDDAITRVARRESVDLIVIATRGRPGFRRLFLGSTAERVVRHAPCPVLVMP